MSELRPIEPIDIAGLTPRAPSSGLPIIEYVDPRSLWVDPSYQRNLSDRSMRMLRRIIEGFDWTKMKPPICAFADDGTGTATLRVLDGQHTAIAAASNPHVSTIPVVVVEAPDTQSQAAAFIGQNTDRLQITAMQLHAAALTAGDASAMEVDRVCRQAGVTVLRNPPSRGVYKPGDTIAVQAISNMIRSDGSDHARTVLRILVEAGVFPIKGIHMKAVDRLLTEPEYGAIEVETLPASILAYPAAMKDASAFSAVHGVTMWKALAAVWFKAAKKRKPSGRHSAPSPAVAEDLAADARPALGGWVPGNLVRRCVKCDQRFRGAPHAKDCANCAYGEANGSAA